MAGKSKSSAPAMASAPTEVLAPAVAPAEAPAPVDSAAPAGAPAPADAPAPAPHSSDVGALENGAETAATAQVGSEANGDQAATDPAAADPNAPPRSEEPKSYLVGVVPIRYNGRVYGTGSEINLTTAEAERLDGLVIPFPE